MTRRDTSGILSIILSTTPLQPKLYRVCLLSHTLSSLIYIYNVFGARFATHLSSFNASSNPNPKESSLYIRVFALIPFALWTVYKKRKHKLQSPLPLYSGILNSRSKICNQFSINMAIFMKIGMNINNTHTHTFLSLP